MEFLCNVSPPCAALKKFRLVYGSFGTIGNIIAFLLGLFGPDPESVAVIVSVLRLPFGFCCCGAHPFCYQLILESAFPYLIRKKEKKNDHSIKVRIYK
jgi:hypothetical protein